ncbi:asparagine synthase-related protein [Nocardia amikacinitolerans]|uniref:asparagine synthase-related protein n=1 Tax=Nocardia amikacinitolerans TaxID=756689 RepID=UPI0020A316DC|nr:asparagine synthase-related protein [Nocardia amikacinitolerans]MCP2276194.1 Asparagine synthase [Nocardia amikacinitolerans]
MLYHAGVCGRIVRQTRRIFQAANVALETPYLDDRVVETALAVRLRDCGHPGRYKPLLTEAMTGIVPQLNLARSTKGEFSAETYLGLRRHRAKLLDLLDSSVLAERGLVDQDALRRAAAATYPRADPLWRLVPVINRPQGTTRYVKTRESQSFRRPPAPP